MIRSTMGRPRRLSATFLLQERRKLSRYRSDIRLVQQGKPPVHSMKDGPFVYQVPQALAVGQTVSGDVAGGHSGMAVACDWCLWILACLLGSGTLSLCH